jgi:hypothetical protein
VILHTFAALGYIDLPIGDETGFSMAPSVLYGWLKPKDYSAKEQLQQATFNILRQFGAEFQINFSVA